MMALTESQNEIREYLLGSLSAEARERVETRLLTEEEFYAELVAWEDELIDQYVNEGLTDEERSRFEAHFLCDPERQQKIRFARALQKYIDAQPKTPATEPEPVAPPSVMEDASPGFTEKLRAFWSSQSWGLRTAAALCLVAFVGGALWLAFFRERAPQTFATFTLNLSASNRAEGFNATQINLPLNVDALKLSLLLPSGTTAESYRAELLSISGESSNVQVTGHDAQSVTVIIPASQLTHGTYALKLFTLNQGAEQRIPGSYFFKVS
ncbi:MAG: hypothetical protein JO360_19030 [Acidobacteria bacterium]|nr:hypothetical protein [Acidobacteriota bacterium]